MREINPLSLSHVSQTSVQCVYQIVMAQVVRRVESFFLEFAPQGFGNIQIGRVGRQKEQVQSPFLPIQYSLLYSLCFVYACIIENHKRFALYVKQKFLQGFQNKLRVNVLLCNLPLALAVYQSKIFELIRLFRKKANLLIGKQPTIRHISLTANVSFITILKVYFSLETQRIKLLQLFYLKVIMFGKRLVFREAPYTFISSASFFKKALKVVSHTFFPLSDSHCAFAIHIRCLLALMADSMPSLSSSCKRMRLRPRPGWFFKPAKPTCLYRVTQLLTLMAHIPAIAPTSLDLRSSAFNNKLWQRIRKQWLEPC